MNGPIDIYTSAKIYDILIEHCGAHPNDKGSFIYNQREGCTEWRFSGKLGFGGKFWNTNDEFYINCYNEDKDKKKDEIIEKTNELLKPLYEKWVAENGQHK